MRKLIARQLDRMLRVSPILSVGLLIGTTSSNVALLVAWRGVNLYIVITLTALLLSVLALVISNLWAGPLRMVAAVRGSQAIHDPVQVYQLTPFERVLWQCAMIPQMKHQLSIKYDSEFENQIQRLEKWCLLGYIPKEDYPTHLLSYYYGVGEAI